MTERDNKPYPILRGYSIFRENELVYINRSDELARFCNLMHKHDFIEIAYVVSGEGIHTVGGRQYETSGGELYIINYDIPHGFFQKPDSKIAPIVYNCVFMPEFLDISLLCSHNFEDITSSFLFKSIFQGKPMPTPDLKLTGTDFNEIGELFSRMHTEYILMRKGYLDLIRAYLIELIIKIFRYTENSNDRTPISKNDEMINKAVEYMRRNYSGEITLSDLAMQSFISKNYFSRLFKEITGTNVSDYIQYLRIDKACSLLKETNLKVIDIASQVGFSDLKFFYKVFKKITGKTPGNYRK